MSLRTVGGTVTGPDGSPVPSAPVIIELVLAEAFVVIGSYSLASKLTLQTDPAGVWSTPLQCNDELTPVGTLYQVTEKVPGQYGGSKVYLIQVLSGLPAGPVNQVLNLIVPELVPVGGTYAPVGSGPQGIPGPIGPPGYVTVADNAALSALAKVEGQPVYVTTTDCLWVWTGTYYHLLNIPVFASQAAADTALNVSQHKGQPYYLQSNNASEGPQWRNNNNNYSRPWHMAWGEIFYVSTTTVQTGIGVTEVDLTSLTTGTITAPPNRLWLVHGFAQLLGQTGATRPLMRITDGANAIKGQGIDHLAAAGQYVTLDAWERFNTGAGGSVTRKLRGSTNANTIDTAPSATNPNFLHIIDIGPSGAPV